MKYCSQTLDIKGKYDKDVITLVKTAEESEVRHSTKTNTKTIVQQRANTEITRNFFGIRVAKVWNRLPEKIVMAPSINTCSFKNRLDKYWKDQKLYYEDYRAIIDGSHVRNESSNENEESGE